MKSVSKHVLITLLSVPTIFLKEREIDCILYSTIVLNYKMHFCRTKEFQISFMYSSFCCKCFMFNYKSKMMAIIILKYKRMMRNPMLTISIVSSRGYSDSNCSSYRRKKTYITVINNCSADNNMMKAIGLFRKKKYNPPLLRMTIENSIGEVIE